MQAANHRKGADVAMEPLPGPNNGQVPAVFPATKEDLYAMTGGDLATVLTYYRSSHE